MKNFTYPPNQRIRLLIKKYQMIKNRLYKAAQSGKFPASSKRKQQQLLRRLDRYTLQLSKITKGSLATGIASTILATIPTESVQAQSFTQEGGATPFGLTSDGSTSLVDFDGDGDLDAFITNLATGVTSFFRNTGTATNPNFVQEGGAAPFGLTALANTHAPVFFDIDGDGDIDVFRGRNDDARIDFFRNTAGNLALEVAGVDGQPFGLLSTPIGGGFTSHSNINFVDIDGDGDLDAFVGEKGGGVGSRNTVFFRNTGSATNPTFVAQAALPTGLSGVANSGIMEFADIDNDGDFDAFRNDPNPSTGYSFYRNTGTSTSPSFTKEGGSPPFGLSTAGDVSFGDLDGDGDLDGLKGNAFYRNAQATPPPPPLDPIPTMSQWGLMIFGLLVLNLGLFFIKSKELLRRGE